MRPIAPEPRPTRFHIAFGRARKIIVDDDRRDRGGKADGGRQQRLGDARRHDREIGGLRLGNPDEAVHDPPDRAEQADEGRRRADCGDDAHAIARMARASIRTISEKCEATRSLMPASPTRSSDMRTSCIAAAISDDSTRGLRAERHLRLAERPDFAQCGRARRPSCRRARAKLEAVLAKNTVHVTSEAKIRPTITALTRMSAARNIDHGDNSCSMPARRRLGRPAARSERRGRSGALAAGSSCCDAQRDSRRRSRWRSGRCAVRRGDGAVGERLLRLRNCRAADSSRSSRIAAVADSLHTSAQ